jgi:hypothetical protein
MTVEEIELASRHIETLAGALVEQPTAERVKALQTACNSYAKRMRPGRFNPFGNVAEQLTRVSTAASAFRKGDLRSTQFRESELKRALARVHIVIDMHRMSD